MNILTTSAEVGTQLQLQTANLANPINASVEAASSPTDSGAIATVDNEFLNDVAPDSSTPLVLTLATLAQIGERSVVYINGVVNLQPTTLEETQLLVTGSISVELSLDGGATFADQPPNPQLYFCQNGPAGEGSGAVSLPFIARSNGVTITGDVQLRVTVHNDGVSNTNQNAAVAAEGLFLFAPP